MAHPCDFYSTCTFFKEFCQPGAVAEGFAKLYCLDKEKSLKCARLQYRTEHGEPPAANMTPTGAML